MLAFVPEAICLCVHSATYNKDVLCVFLEVSFVVLPYVGIRAVSAVRLRAGKPEAGEEV
jgi:hypothetical protein